MFSHTRIRRWLLWFVAGCLLMVVGCGDETPPEEQLTLRDALGLLPERMAALDEGTRVGLRETLFATWSQERDTLAVRMTTESSASPDMKGLQVVHALDQSRALALQAPVVSAQVNAQGDDATVVLTALAPASLGITSADLVMRVPADDPRFDGALVYDTRWGRLSRTSLEGETERARVEALEPALRHALATLSLSSDVTINIVPAPQAPMAIWFVSSERVLLINPNLLYLLDFSELEADVTTPVLQTRAQPLEVIDTCTRLQQERCLSCFGQGGDATQPQCAPLFPPRADAMGAEAQARDECAEITMNPTTMALYCYHRTIENNRICFVAVDPTDVCGAAAGPALTVEDLQRLTPMLDDAVCQRELQDCENTRVSNVPVPVGGDPTTAPAPTPVPEPVPESRDEGPDAGDVFCDTMTEIGVYLTCIALIDEDACDTDDGDGEAARRILPGHYHRAMASSRQDGKRAPLQGLLVVLPLGLCLGAWWVDRQG